jgi:tetratricopeptide (TPR) repeat protein
VPGRKLFRRLCSWRGLAALLVAGLLVGILGRHCWAWYNYRAASAALERYQPDVAQRHLTACLAVWPNSKDAHLLASRAARQSGDFKEADRQLRACQEAAGETSDEIAFEWALLQAADGGLREVEEFLQRQAGQEPRLAPLVFEAVAEGYIRLHRHLDALACVERWLAADPDNLRALELRGQSYQTGKQSRKGSEDFRAVLEREPNRDQTRWHLVLCLLDMGSYDEALSHLEYLERKKPDDPEVQVRLARCQNMRGEGDTARKLLDAVLASHPRHALALRTRGQFALADRQPAEAEAWLRRAAEVSPHDYQSQWLLLQALQHQKKVQEARTQLLKTEQVKEQAERLGELTGRKLFEQPLDPALHCETGVLLLRRGDPTGVGWLKSALSLDADYQPAHAALADHYERQGDAKQAEEHRRRK